MFGFISSLSNHPRVYSAIAKNDSSVHVFPRDDFLSVLKNNPDIAVKILNNFAEELRLYNSMLFSVDENYDDAAPEDKLYKLGIFYLNNNKYEPALYVFKRYLEYY